MKSDGTSKEGAARETEKAFQKHHGVRHRERQRQLYQRAMHEVQNKFVNLRTRIEKFSSTFMKSATEPTSMEYFRTQHSVTFIKMPQKIA